MRILMVAACPLPWPRGTPIRIHRMAEALENRGHDVHVATYPLGDEATPIPYEVHRVGDADTRMAPEPGPSLRKIFLLDPLLYQRVRALLETLSCDVVHAHHYEGLIVSLCARVRARATRVPIVYDAHTLLASELPFHRLGIPAALAGRIGRALDLRLPRRADHVIAVSDRMRRWLVTEALVREDRVSLISNGVEHGHFQQIRTQPHDSGAPRIVYAGNLADYQGIELLLQVFQRIRAVSQSAQLLLVTDSNFDSWRRRVEGLGIADSVSVIRADYASLPTHLARAAVLVNPRVECDGLPQKLLNYMAAARPIVSFAGSAEPLQHERTALVVPDGDVGAFADAVLRLIRHPELGASLGEAASRQAISHHGWSQVAESVERVYAHVLAEGAIVGAARA